MLVYRFPDGEEREIPVSAIVEAVLLAVRRRRRLKLLSYALPALPTVRSAAPAPQQP